MAPRNRERRNREPVTVADRILATGEASLLDVVDNALTKGVVLSGDLTLALANVDLVYARLSLLLCAADRVLPGESTDFLRRRRQRTNRRRA
jgi:gas vesicle structural protein